MIICRSWGAQTRGLEDTGAEVHAFHAADFLFPFNPFAKRGIDQYDFRSPHQQFESLMQFASIALATSGIGLCYSLLGSSAAKQ
jgi:hypothetical protein